MCELTFSPMVINALAITVLCVLVLRFVYFYLEERAMALLILKHLPSKTSQATRNAYVKKHCGLKNVLLRTLFNMRSA